MKKRKKKPLFSLAAAEYFRIRSEFSVSFKRGLIGKSGYVCKKYPCLVASFGCEGDRHAPISYIDGSFYLRDRGNIFITYGFRNIKGKIKWFNKEGWLPCFVSEYKTAEFEVCIESFADKVRFEGNDFEIVYSRVTAKNISGRSAALPKVSKWLEPINRSREGNLIPAREAAVFDYAIFADRFGGKSPFPDKKVLSQLGGFDEHYKKMKKYWVDRLSSVAQITKLPDKKLINAYKAGFVYTMIIKDGDELHVGENGYDRVFDHDVIGIIASLLTIGDFRDFKKYAEYILKNVQYPDARWKYSWVFALYLQKTGDIEYIKSKFEQIKINTHYIQADRCSGGKGIMRKTLAIDSNGYWTIDNWSALFGLLTYGYICREIHNKEEEEWAKKQYISLLDAANLRIGQTIDEHRLEYLPISMTEPNELGARSDPRDANWASMFLFGRWAWDGYLFGGEQHGVMLEMIDDTYKYGFERRKDIAPPCNFGGYPHGYFCSSYNAGYASAALRGERFRDIGIKAYQFMIDNAQSGPFSWWEGIGYPEKSSPWSIPHSASGGGSCQHMWGQATATKVLFDSLICEKADGTVIIGRGIPSEWLSIKEEIEVNNYPLSGNRRVGFYIKSDCKVIEVSLTGDEINNDVSIEFPILKERVFIPAGNKNVKIFI